MNADAGSFRGLAGVPLLKDTSPFCKPLDWEHEVPAPDDPEQVVWPLSGVFPYGCRFFGAVIFFFF